MWFLVQFLLSHLFNRKWPFHWNSLHLLSLKHTGPEGPSAARSRGCSCWQDNHRRLAPVFLPTNGEHQPSPPWGLVLKSWSPPEHSEHKYDNIVICIGEGRVVLKSPVFLKQVLSWKPRTTQKDVCTQGPCIISTNLMLKTTGIHSLPFWTQKSKIKSLQGLQWRILLPPPAQWPQV
jgi:hypothetical protein